MSRLRSNPFSNWTAAWSVMSNLEAKKLHRAAELAEQANLKLDPIGRYLVGYLTTKLVRNAFWNWRQCNYKAAWADLATADRIVPRHKFDWLSHEKNRLVEAAITSSEASLCAGQVDLALAQTEELQSLRILDWRADRIRAIAGLIQSSEKMARRGQWPGAIEKLRQAKTQRQDLHYLTPRLESLAELQREHARLIQGLRQAICGDRLEAAKYFAEQILAISPEDGTALAVQRGLAVENTPTYETHSIPIDTSAAVIVRPPREKTGEIGTPSTGLVENFSIWVDGVGGFLVCPAPVVNVGCFVERPGVDIPVQADLRRRHLRIELHHDQFIIVPIGPTFIDDGEILKPTALRDGQILEMTGRVKWKFRQPHPLSSSARVEFVSPHRTVPWSDAILLMADTLIFGPQRQNHIYCPGMKEDLILFRRQGQLFVRSESSIRVDGKEKGTIAPIQIDSSISGQDFSIKLESILQPV